MRTDSGTAAMDHEELHHHIESTYGVKLTQARGLTFHLLASCWPGGSQDRTCPRARIRVQGASPLELRDVLVPCSCSTGRCARCG